MPFVKGSSGNPKGRPAGSLNVFTKTVRDIVLETFHELQSDPKHCFKAFSVKYPREAHAIFAKLIPTDLRAELTAPEGIKIIYAANPECLPIGTNPEGDSGILGE